jgi:hypothetical protein
MYTVWRRVIEWCRIMNWRRFGRKRHWPNWDITPKIPRRDWGEPRKSSARLRRGVPFDDLQNKNLNRNHYINLPCTEEGNNLFMGLKCNEVDCNFMVEAIEPMYFKCKNQAGLQTEIWTPHPPNRWQDWYPLDSSVRSCDIINHHSNSTWLRNLVNKS